MVVVQIIISSVHAQAVTKVNDANSLPEPGFGPHGHIYHTAAIYIHIYI